MTRPLVGHVVHEVMLRRLVGRSDHRIEVWSGEHRLVTLHGGAGWPVQAPLELRTFFDGVHVGSDPIDDLLSLAGGPGGTAGHAHPAGEGTLARCERCGREVAGDVCPHCTRRGEQPLQPVARPAPRRALAELVAAASAIAGDLAAADLGSVEERTRIAREVRALVAQLEGGE